MQHFRNKDLYKLGSWLKDIRKSINSQFGSSYDSDKQLRVFFDGIQGSRKAFAVTGYYSSFENSKYVKEGISNILREYGATGIIGTIRGDYVDIAFDFKPKVLKELGVECIDFLVWFDEERPSLEKLPSYMNPTSEDALRYF